VRSNRSPRPVVPLLVALALPIPLGALPVATRPPALAVQADADERYLYLAGLAERGMHARVVETARGFLSEFPRHAKAALARYRLAGALFELRRFDEARPELTALARDRGFEFRGECLLRLGQCELEAGRFEPARHAFEEALGTDAAYLADACTFLAGEAAFREGDLAAAAARYEALLAGFPASVHRRDAERGLAWCALRRGDAAAALARAEALLGAGGEEREDVRRELHLLSGEALLEAGRPADALAAFRAVDGGALADAALRGRGFASAALGDHAGAAAAFRELLERHPASAHAAEARLQAGVQALLAGDAAAAERALAADELAGDPEARYWLARAVRDAGRPEDALALADEALRARPGDELAGRLQALRGTCLSELGRAGEARRAFERSGSDDAALAAAREALVAGDAADAERLAGALLGREPAPDVGDAARLVLGEARLAAGRHRAAREAFEPLAAREDRPLAATARARAGWCRFLEGDAGGAARDFAAALELGLADDADEEARFMLGRALQDAGDADGARAAYGRSLERWPDGAHLDEALFGLAQLEPPERAERHLARLLAKRPDGPLAAKAALSLGELALRDGRHRDAQRAYERALELDPAGPEGRAARYGRAWCAWERGDAEAALDDVARLAGDAEAPTELRAATLELGLWIHRTRGDAAAAERAWRALLELPIDDARRLAATRVAAEAARAADDAPLAERLFDVLLERLSDPEVARDVLVEGAYAALEAGDVDRAEAKVSVAARDGADAGVAEAAFHVGEARYAAGDDAGAGRLYERAAAAGEPEVAARALYKLGWSALRSGDAAGAESAFAALVERHPASELAGEGLFLLGEARFRQGRYGPAADALERCLAEAPDHDVAPKALFRCGLAHAELGAWRAAEARLGELARRFPDFANGAEAELVRGEALAALDERRAARAAFERVLARDRGELAARARLALGGLAEVEGRTEEALAEYLKVAVLWAGSPQAADGLLGAGRCLEAAGDPAGAAARYRELLADHPDAPAAAEARRRLAALER